MARAVLAFAREHARSTSWLLALRHRSWRAWPTCCAKQALPCSARTRRVPSLRAPRRTARSSWRPTASRPRATRSFTDEAAALAYVDELGAPIVVKADGLAAGQGRRRGRDGRGSARCRARLLLRRLRRCRRHGGSSKSAWWARSAPCSPSSPGGKAFCMATAQDHKRAFDGDLRSEHGRHGRVLAGAHRDRRRAGCHGERHGGRPPRPRRAHRSPTITAACSTAASC